VPRSSEAKPVMVSDPCTRYRSLPLFARRSLPLKLGDGRDAGIGDN
jgi:hypothetical protein